MSRAELRIRVSSLENNIKSLYRFSQKPIIAVLKANAYGVGALQVALLMDKLEEISALAVACVEEGIDLRKVGVRKKILVLGGVLKGEEKAFVEYNLTPVVSHKEHLKALAGLNIPIQIKYDTGMGRLGFLEEVIKDNRVEGIHSHLSSTLDEE